MYKQEGQGVVKKHGGEAERRNVAEKHDGEAGRISTAEKQGGEREKSMYAKMNSAVSIGHLSVANRVAMTAMGVNLATKGGGVSDDVIAYYEARARGGVGLIITEVTRVTDGAGAGEPCQLAARGAHDIPDLQRLVDAIHKYDTKIFIQLQHPGGLATPLITGTLPVIPSMLKGTPENTAHELSAEECEELVKAFVTGAAVAQAAGADGVELHGAHGYLINAFLSPAMNHRSDAYGGSFENRMRFVAEILQGIRYVCGVHFPVSVRINAEEALSGGLDLSEAQKIASALEQAGADAINVSCLSIGTIEPGTFAQGWKKHLGQAIKQAVSLPVIAVDNIKEPHIAEQLLQEGVCDLVGVARAHLADPEWCNKAFCGREADIRNCIGCLACFDEISKLHRIKCAVNPVTGREREYACLERNGQGRKVAVIGGGPAGIEAALTLEERGFSPVLFEGAQQLGGALNSADKGFGKSLITRYITFLATQIEQRSIEVRRGEQASVDMIKKLDPYAVFVACGAEPFIPSIPGIDGENVCTAEEVLLDKVQPKGTVVVVGLGMTGLETAEVLANRGCELVLVEMLNEIGAGMYHTVVEDVMGRIQEYDPQVLTHHRLERIMPHAAMLIRLSDNESVEIKADWVVLSLGVQPRTTVVKEFKAAFKRVVIVGDAVRGARILEATQDAHGKAFALV